MRAPSLLRRRWLVILVASPFVLYGLRWVYMSRADIPMWFRRAVSSSKDFFYEHVHEPSLGASRQGRWLAVISTMFFTCPPPSASV